MSLSVDARHCGTVYVIRCTGRIVAGEELGVLEASISRGLREFLRFVLHVGDVNRLDSTGVGLLVRFLSHTRNRGGDFRLAAAPPFLSDLLRMTKLAGIFRVYDSEEEAIVSFLKEPKAASPGDASVGPMALFVDQSPDLCAFVRALLHHHGYEVLSTCRIHDAKMLLAATKFDYIVLGPDSSKLPSDNVVAALKSLASGAATVQLQSGFKYEDPERAGLELLRAMESAAKP
jgi:anti-sigma B factor antagonist